MGGGSWMNGTLTEKVMQVTLALLVIESIQLIVEIVSLLVELKKLNRKD
jgi:hypothetical protein